MKKKNIKAKSGERGGDTYIDRDRQTDRQTNSESGEWGVGRYHPYTFSFSFHFHFHLL